MAKAEREIVKSPVDESGMNEPVEAGIFSQAKNFIIAIGIDEYGSGGVVEDFKYGNCKKDVKDFVETLTSTYSNFEVFGSVLTDNAATKENILNTIDGFINNEIGDYNKIENNLIIYFSGHGATAKVGFSQEGTGCWVPNGCKNISDAEVLTLDILEARFSRLQTQNFLLISDSCRSGKIFAEISNPNFIANSQKIEGREISRWAIVSSRADELSKAGGPGMNSKFTQELLKIFENPEKGELRVTSIFDKLEQSFAQDRSQKPYVGRLQFKNIPNSGQFIFQMKPEQKKINRRKEFLQKGLKILNYDSQKKMFDEFEKKVKKQFVIFSGTPSCGLNLLSWRAKTYRKFPQNYISTFFGSPFLAEGKDDIRVLNIFNASLRQKFSTLDQLSAHLLSKLEKQTILIELHFYRDQKEANSIIRPEEKKELLDQVGKFVSSINNTYPDDNKLIVFIIDQDQYDYKNIFPSNTIGDINIILMPVVAPMEFKNAEDWYDSFREMYVDPDSLRIEFDELLGSAVLSKLKSIITETKGFPGSAIRKICMEAECAMLAEKILYPNQ